MLNIREDKRYTKSTEKQLLGKINRSTALHTGYLRFFTFLAALKQCFQINCTFIFQQVLTVGSYDFCFGYFMYSKGVGGLIIEKSSLF